MSKSKFVISFKILNVSLVIKKPIKSKQKINKNQINRKILVAHLQIVCNQCTFSEKSMHPFLRNNVHRQGTDRQTDGQTDGWTG